MDRIFEKTKRIKLSVNVIHYLITKIRLDGSLLLIRKTRNSNTAATYNCEFTHCTVVSSGTVGGAPTPTEL